MSDRTHTTTPAPDLLEALKSASRTPETPEGVAWDLTRLILLCSAKTPSRAEILDLYAECLRAAEGERQPRDLTVH